MNRADTWFNNRSQQVNVTRFSEYRTIEKTGPTLNDPPDQEDGDKKSVFIVGQSKVDDGDKVQ